MKRQLIVVGLAAFALLVFAFISATVAAPGNAPMLQVGENEPNDSFDDAASVPVPGYVTGVITSDASSADTDFFVINTEPGRQYQARLTIWTTDILKLQMVLYNGDRGYRDTSTSSSSYTSLSWTAYQTSHYVRIEALTSNTTTLQTANYQLNVEEFAATPTPTDTPSPDAWDEYEPNDSFSEVHDIPIATAATLEQINFHPYSGHFHPYSGRAGPDEDWFTFYVKAGLSYEATTSNLVGVDTYMEIRDQNNSVIKSSEDEGGGFASQATWQASYDGDYYIRIINRGSSSDSDDTYSLTIEQLSPTATPTPSPTSTPQPGATSIPGADQYEPNYDFESATTIGTSATYQANFVPWNDGKVDNDYYKLWIKPGLHFVCETLDLAPGVDTNMIVYDGNYNAIGGNDDVALGDYRSRFAYFSTYEGWLYILIGHGGRLPIGDVEGSDYKVRCEMQVPGGATATSTPGPTNTPQPTAEPGSQTATPTPSGSPIATPTPSEGLTVHPLTTPTPPAPATTPAPRFIPIRMLVYYDANDDHQPGAGEGIVGISAQAYEVATNQLLAQGFTDEQGNLEFTVSAQGPVRVSVPFFGFSQLVASQGASIYLRVPPQPLLGGAP